MPFRRETAVRAGVHPFTVSLEPDMRGVADLVQKCAVNRVAGWMPNGMLGRAARDHLDPNTKAGLKKAHDYLTLAVRMLNGIANDLEDARVKLERAASRKKGGR